MKQLSFVLLLVVLVGAPAAAWSGGFEDLESRVKEITLPNGLTFLVLERPDAPVFSFRTYVDAGGVDEAPGITGIAHMFEHMAFKGTETIGTTDFTSERDALKKVDEAVWALASEQEKGLDADPQRLQELEAAFKEAQDKAREYVVSNEYSQILDENGVTGLNASTFFDWTQYYYSLPSNRLELWARLEGDRMTNPVMREFYTERDVVYEERRNQESSPTGRLFSTWINAAYQAHPYGVGGVIGHSSDLKKITREDAVDFYNKQYVGSNMTVAVVGDVKAKDMEKLAEKYFAGVPQGDEPGPVRTEEPRHDYEVRIIRKEDAQPVVLIGYHIPSGRHPDWFAAELMGDILGSGRSSRLYQRLVKEDKSAAQVFAGSGVLGNKYSALMLVQALVSADSNPEDVEAAIYEEIDRFVKEGPSEEELAKVKTRNKASFIRGLRSNNGLAGQLAAYEELHGDWRKLFRYVDDLQAVSAEDVRRVAEEALRWDNRVVGVMQKADAPETPAS